MNMLIQQKEQNETETKNNNKKQTSPNSVDQSNNANGWYMFPCFPFLLLWFFHLPPTMSIMAIFRCYFVCVIFFFIFIRVVGQMLIFGTAIGKINFNRIYLFSFVVSICSPHEGAHWMSDGDNKSSTHWNEIKNWNNTRVASLRWMMELTTAHHCSDAHHLWVQLKWMRNAVWSVDCEWAKRL